uniref:PsbP C-terminal domain-containing protein n=1 Tax=Skeletonema marinoi TaxID=267567 RepID=A0A7S2PGT5_9STRA|mmetsp:Transcript_21430/g.36351  ORF Transcript_21430/g.36351 Transcript_21430/m.36351 type:complete len:289 (+) Transcript_21430:95-961(+)
MKTIYLISLFLHASTAFQPSGLQQKVVQKFSRCNNALKSHNDDMSDNIDRRSFLSSGAILASSVLLTGASPSAFAEDNQAAAIYAYRSSGLPSLRPIGLTKLTTRYEGYVEAPKSYAKSGIPISFDFPSDWLQLDKLGGGIQYVDQRNGDKLYILKATLPADTNLKTVAKSWFADVILSPEGDVARSGVVAEGGRISRSQMTTDCTAEDAPSPCIGRRRMILKYDTVTGSGVQTVERRGLIDAYQIDNDVYMMVTSSNAIKFEQKGSRERETVENICQSFKVGPAALS